MSWLSAETNHQTLMVAMVTAKLDRNKDLKDGCDKRLIEES